MGPDRRVKTVAGAKKVAPKSEWEMTKICFNIS
jgi:hypothetical protein